MAFLIFRITAIIWILSTLLWYAAKLACDSHWLYKKIEHKGKLKLFLYNAEQILCLMSSITTIPFLIGWIILILSEF